MRSPMIGRVIEAVRLARVSNAMDEGDYSEALRRVSFRIRHFPVTAHALKGSILFVLDEPTDADRYLRKSLAENREKSEVARWLSDYCHMLLAANARDIRTYNEMSERLTRSKPPLKVLCSLPIFGAYPFHSECDNETKH
jgi:hypothetical protein